MLLRLITITLVSLLVGPYGTALLAETKHDLIGPVRTVTTKAPGRIETETYDRAGRLVEAVIHLAHGNSSTHYLFHHDPLGNLLEETAVEASGKLIYRKRFGYGRDEQGRETASVAVSEDGEFLYAEFSLYDRAGNLAEQFLVHGTTVHRTLFDVLGHVIYSSQYNKGELFSELRHRYDEEGRLAELTSYNAEGAMTGRVANEHDAAGRRVRATTEKFHAGEKRVWITTYDYDDRGNWIREVTAEEPTAFQETGSPPALTVQERVIEYYDSPENQPQ
jgi:hypothetical protein